MQTAPIVIDPPGPKVEYNAYKLGERKFEDLCCALMRAEPHIQGADLYGRPRQEQYGVDVLGGRRDGRGIEVISCKCYSQISKGDIGVFVEDFLKHWKSHWKSQRVKRFVLAITTELRSHERGAELKRAGERFKKIKVRFEVWHTRELTHRIRRDMDIRRDFFAEWPAQLGTQAIQPAPRTREPVASPLPAAVVSHIHQQQAFSGESTAAQLDTYTEAWRRGERSKVKRALTTLRRNKARWDALDPEVQARVLRMQALHALDERSLVRAELLIREADRLAPNSGRRLHALLTYERHGAEAALKVLGKPESKDEALVQAALLLQSGQVRNALATLRRWQAKAKEDPEWYRLMASTTFAQGQGSVALDYLREAEKLAPDWKSLRRMGAVLRYGAALSPAAAFRITRVPEPVHPDLVRHDDDSQHLLKDALVTFDRLAATNLADDERVEIEMWKLACLANLLGREKDASLACLALIGQRPIPATAVFWALTRGYPLEIQSIIQRLERKLQSRTRNIDDVQALLACHLAANQNKKAEDAVTRAAKRFKTPDALQVLTIWQERLSIAAGNATAAAVHREPFTALHRIVREASQSNDWGALERFLKSAEDRADVLLAACQALASHGQWPRVTPHAERLLESVGSAQAIRLAVYAWYNTEAVDLALDVLERFARAFPGGVLPPDLQRIKAYGTARRGRLLEARLLARKLARETQQASDKFFAAQLHIRSGDVSGALPYVREALDKATPEQLLRLISSVFNEGPELARQMPPKALVQWVKPPVGAFALGGHSSSGSKGWPISF